MTLVDVKITQGSYWKGAQIPYWLYMISVILCLDHLLLRSPVTFLLKIVTLIPFLGFWYFYDLAQAFGERELVEQYGIGVPFYGPVGIGAGIFINKTASNLAPPAIPKPWLFMIYALLSIVFIVFPLNKLVIGDYWGSVGQMGMYMGGLLTLGFTALLAICWGFYDAYRVAFDTKSLFEKGAARVFPATSFGLDPHFNKGALGPEADPSVPVDNRSIYDRAVSYARSLYTVGPKMALGAVTSATKMATNTATDAAKMATNTVTDAAKMATNSATSAAKMATNTATSAVETVTDTVSDVAKTASNTVTGAVTGAAKRVTNTASGAVDAVTQKGTNAAQAINTATGGLSSKFVDTVGSKVENVGGKVLNLVQTQSNKIESKVDNAINKAIDKGVGSVVDRLTEIPDKAATAVTALGKVATAEADVALAAVQTATAITDIAKAGPKVLGKVAEKLTNPAVQEAAVTSVVDNYLPAAAAGIMGKFIPTAPVPGASSMPVAAAAMPAAAAAMPAAAAAAAMPAAASAMQKGGAFFESSSPAISSTVLLFSVALLAFGGYVMYSVRKMNDVNRNERADDTPPDAEPVRGSPKANRA